MGNSDDRDETMPVRTVSLWGCLPLVVILALLALFWGYTATFLTTTGEVRWYWARDLTVELGLWIVGLALFIQPSNMFEWYWRLRLEFDAPPNEKPERIVGVSVAVAAGIVILGLASLFLYLTLAEILRHPECLNTPCSLEILR